MKELTPEIIKILEQFTDPKEREEILQAFEDGWYDKKGTDRPSPNGITEFCDECKEQGYCKYNKDRKSIFLKDNEICNLIPIHYDDEYWRLTGNYSKKHLTAAFEAFHQQDYETSTLNAQAVIDENKTLAAPYLVMAICQYFLG